ncbi:protease inhibitor I42 family protein [Candidatus Bipolaricaulota bacterium]
MVKLRSGLAVTLVLVLFGLCGCSLFTTTVDESDSGSIQKLDVGDLLQIRLIGNASTGYEWVRVEPVSFEGSPLEVVKEKDYQTLEHQLVGAPGEFIFRYRALRPGTVTLQFLHRRPWDVEDPIDTFSVTVWVR